MRPTLFAVFDNVRDELTLAAPVYPAPAATRTPPGPRRRHAWPKRARRSAGRCRSAAPPVSLPPQPEPRANMAREHFWRW